MQDELREMQRNMKRFEESVSTRLGNLEGLDLDGRLRNMEQYESMLAKMKRKLEEQQYLHQKPLLRAYYTRLCRKLSDLFLACHVISTGMVDKADDKLNKFLQGLTGLDGSDKAVSFVREAVACCRALHRSSIPLRA